MSQLKDLLRKYENQTKTGSSTSVSTTANHRLFEVIQQEATKIAAIGLSSSITVRQNKTGLGLLFIIVDHLPNEALWRIWIENQKHDGDNQSKAATIGERKVYIWIFAKFPDSIASNWVRERLINHKLHRKFSPTWGSLELTKVMFYLLKHAVEQDSTAGKFIFLSESCSPIVSLDACFPSLFATEDTTVIDQRSWLRYTNQATNGYGQQQFDALKFALPAHQVYKADQWMVISLFHAEQVIQLLTAVSSKSSKESSSRSNRTEDYPLFSIFRDMHASDEMFFPSLLSALGYIPSTDSDSRKDEIDGGKESAVKIDARVHNCRVTYCDWSASAKNPRTFERLQEFMDSVHLRSAQAEGCLFFRKWKLNVSVSEKSNSSDDVHEIEKWIELVYGEQKSRENKPLVEDFYGKRCTNDGNSPQHKRLCLSLDS